MTDQDLMQDYNDYRHEYDGWDDAPLDPMQDYNDYRHEYDGWDDAPLDLLAEQY